MSNDRLVTAEDLLQKAIRKNGVMFPEGTSGTVTGEVFKIAFYMGLVSMNEYIQDIGMLSEEDMVSEVSGLMVEIDTYLNNDNETDTPPDGSQ